MPKQNENPTIKATGRVRGTSFISEGGSRDTLDAAVRAVFDVESLGMSPEEAFGFSAKDIAGTLLSASLDDNDEEELAEASGRDAITSSEVFDLIRDIKDPEHPLTLEQLSVVDLGNVDVDDEARSVDVRFTPTVPHCSMSTLIGLSLRVKLLRSLPPRLKVRVSIVPGTHVSDVAITKQLNDKERVAAALENDHLVNVVNQCIKGV